jgi:hypothetical protein
MKQIVYIFILFFIFACSDREQDTELEEITFNINNEISVRGGTLNIIGSGFTEDLDISIKDIVLSKEIISTTEMNLIIPPLEAGIYRLNFKKNGRNIGYIDNFKIKALELRYQKLSNNNLPENLIFSKLFAFPKSGILFFDKNRLETEYFERDNNGNYSQNSNRFPKFNGELNQILELDYDNDGDNDFLLCSSKRNHSIFWNNSDGIYIKSNILIDFSCSKAIYENGELAILGYKKDEENNDVTFIKTIIFDNENIFIPKESYDISYLDKIYDFHITDLNKDGINELFILTENSDSSEIVVLQNENSSIETIKLDQKGLTTFCFVDLENDGDSDIFIISKNQDLLLLNDGATYFYDYTSLSIPVDNSDGRALKCKDLNIDGYKDIIIGNYDSLNRLYKNEQDSWFSDQTLSLDVDNSYTENIFIKDIDNNGDFEIIFVDKKEGLKIYKLDEE